MSKFFVVGHQGPHIVAGYYEAGKEVADDKLTLNNVAFGDAYSVVGDGVLFYSKSGLPGLYQLVLRDTAPAEHEICRTPAWDRGAVSVDGSQFYYVALDRSMDVGDEGEPIYSYAQHIKVVDLKVGSMRSVLAGTLVLNGLGERPPFPSVDLAVSPDGTLIVSGVSTTLDCDGLHQVHPIGGLVGLTQGDDCCPCFSPDGKWLYYVHGDSGFNVELWRMPWPPASAGERVRSLKLRCRSVSISPNGSRMLLTQYTDSNATLLFAASTEDMIFHKLDLAPLENLFFVPTLPQAGAASKADRGGIEEDVRSVTTGGLGI